ncbi:hypothetical protein NE683_05665 [Bariatricus massiliensis]|uniref:Phage protein n=1 Tax=Bariatricus massiliensis TaxID=1745713 RepID=A0ABS8DFJ1_9FIRM|nr:hypothetical protein [Bariatricus massiliensis]MCB7304069.1 hypothetical protein [Bariatricus massiliensis]MCB7374500.1 hypothetical protein [Bariatricus massiliensis]MCB7387179.1 hypothetical protein [Bariatricus massiliensis]MCB7411341.1 hypothetical protein [Bariatricus massiliensis]MCQ5252714.1 hypothetical protein [Bariatricus massiliensis]
MNKEIRLNMNSDVYEKFCLALKLTNESEETVIENFMRSYIARTFEKVSQEYNPKVAEKQNKAAAKDYYGKALNRIPVWALKPEQYNHKIIKAYFTAVNTSGKATVTRMEQLCSDKDHPELYVPTFKNNYSQMKLDGPKSHGKVFEDDGDEVWIWSEVEEMLMKYKDSFFHEEA